MVTLCPLANTVAVLKVTVTAFPVIAGNLSAVTIVLETAVTTPGAGSHAGCADIICTASTSIADTKAAAFMSFQ
jgi:hypothetical protein